MKNLPIQLLAALAALPALSACAQTRDVAAPVAGAQIETRAAAQQLPRAQTQPSPAFAANDFIESIGINGAPLQTRIYEDGPFKGAGTTFDAQVFYDLGIRYYRAVLKYDLTLENQPQQVTDAWKKSGARAMLFLDNNNVKDPLEQVKLLQPYDVRALAEVEGPNEPNNKFPPQDLNIKYKGQTDEAAAALYMDDFYRAIKADDKLKNLPVVAFSAIFSDLGLAKGHVGFDRGNIHSYQNYGVPSSSLEDNITRFNNIYPAGAIIKPFVPTETGYNVEADKSNGTFKFGSYRAQALNIPMLLAEYFRHGIERTYLFAIQNADGYGLLESDLKTKRPSYFAVKNFLAQINEAKWNPQTLSWDGTREFTPRSLNFTLENAPDTVHSLTLQRSNGQYNLLIWNEVKNFDQDANKDLFPASVPVRLKFGNLVFGQATILTQNSKGEYDSQTVNIANNVLQMNVPSSVCIVKINVPPSPRNAAPPVAVAGLQGTATAHQADLNWNAAPGAQGYFVYRNGWHIATTNEPKFSERTSWLRPGLGYTYEVQAFDQHGQQAPRAKTVVFTPNGRPDLVVTRVWSEGNEVGKPAQLRAQIKNIGDGPTPLDTTNAITFLVNGNYTSFGGIGEVLQPRQEREIKPDGGNLGWAPDKAGSYVVTAQADDVNRVSGETSETNNKTDATLVFGEAGAGQLLLSTQLAPGNVNLAQEGTRDWVAFGSQNTEGKAALKVAQRKDGANLIGDLSEFGDGYLSSTLGSPIQIQWPGGQSNSGLWWNGAGHGVSFDVAASGAEQTLKLYVSGINGASGKMEVSLSDGSAPALVSTAFNGNRGNGNWAPIPDSFSGVYVVKFKAAPGAKLNVRWSLNDEPNAWAGQVRLQAITLAG